MINLISNPTNLWNNPDPVSITVVGTGGTGSQLLVQLGKIHAALRGLGRPGLTVIAYDNDTVTEANIGRQQFSPSDIGKAKVTVLIQRINRFYGTQWMAIPEMYEEKGSCSANLIIGCVDNIKSRKTIYSNLKRESLFGDVNMDRIEYFIDTGNDRDFGQVVFWNNYPHSGKKKMRSVFDIFGTPEEKPNTPSCSMQEALAKQHILINTAIATYAGTLVWDILTKKELDNQGIIFNLKSMKTKLIPIKWK